MPHSSDAEAPPGNLIRTVNVSVLGWDRFAFVISDSPDNW
jgi:hypothetical protein